MNISDEQKVQQIARMLAGYDDPTWAKLKAGRKATYQRAAANLLHDATPVFARIRELGHLTREVSDSAGRLDEIRRRWSSESGDTLPQGVADIQFLLAEIDSLRSATPQTRRCTLCGHIKLTPWRGYCQHEVNPIGQPTRFCGCTCVFETNT